MPFDQIIVKSSLVYACTPVTVDIGCDPTNYQNYRLQISNDTIVFKRQNLEAITELLLCINSPFYAGCNKIDMNSQYVADGLLNTISGSNIVRVKLCDIGIDGSLTGNESTMDFTATGTKTAYKYTIRLTPLDNPMILNEFTGCAFELKIQDSIVLTATDGYPVCYNSYDDECKFICGNLLICGVNEPYIDCDGSTGVTGGYDLSIVNYNENTSPYGQIGSTYLWSYINNIHGLTGSYIPDNTTEPTTLIPGVTGSGEIKVVVTPANGHGKTFTLTKDLTVF